MRAALLVALAVAWPIHLGAQSGTGRITGTVHDSTRAGPLAGATVLVAGTALRSLTDAQGRFIFSSVPVGLVQLFFVHARLDTLEYTPLSAAVEVTANSDQVVQFALPAAETLARESCGSEKGTSRLLEGVVATTTSGQPVANALVEVRWQGGSARDTTGAYGLYRFCTVPTNQRLTLRAELLGRFSEEATVAREESSFTRRNLLLDFGVTGPQFKTSLRASTGALQVVGQVRDAASSAPINGAMLRLVGTPFQSLSNSRGGFSFAFVPAGDYTLEVEHIGYGKREQHFQLPPGASVQLDVELPPTAIALKGLTVRALTAEEHERRVSPTANRIIGEAQLDAAVNRGASLPDVLRQHVTGLFMREGTFEATDNNLPQAILCVESRRSPAFVPPPRPRGRAAASTFPPCDMIPVFVDDARISAAGNYLRFTPLDMFVRIEYLPAVAASLRYGLSAENKGVLALYTRRAAQRKR